jgi:HupE / UreJ protein
MTRLRLARWHSRLAVYTCAVLTLFCASAAAHDRTTSYSAWEIRGRHAHVTMRLSQLDVSRFPWSATAGENLERTLGAYLTGGLRLLADDVPCALTDGPRPLSAAPGRLVYEWGLKCPETGALQIRSDVFLDVASAHLHFARVNVDAGPALERVLSDSERSWVLRSPSPTRAGEPVGTSLAGYVVLGVEHILSGYDHLAFLLALLLIGGSLGAIAKVVTGFTVAHSITLGLTVLGYIRPEPAPVEALIGLSIALVAAENVWLAGPRHRLVPWVITGALAVLAVAAARGYGRVPAVTLAGLALFAICYFGLLARLSSTGALRWSIAFIFGFVHGFAFAAVLVEAGLPTERLAAALFGFNAGVELGQLAAVAAVWPLLRLLSRRDDGWRLAVLNYGSVAVLTLGVFWFVSRAFG